MKTRASIIVVSYNTREMTLACLESVFANGGMDGDVFEVIVVDNASTGGSADAIAAQFPQVRLIRSQVNLGFAAANNLAARVACGEAKDEKPSVGRGQGLEALRGSHPHPAAPWEGEEKRPEYLLLLNPDTVVLDGAIEKLLAFAEANPDAGIWGGRTVFADGSLNPSSCWRRMTVWNQLCRAAGLSSIFPNSPIFNREAYGGWARDTVREVDIVTGCFFLIRRELWERLGGFDEAFFMYGEEADLCLRARKLGARPIVTPDATIVHHGGASETVRADKIVRLYRAKADLMRRHWSRPAAAIGLALQRVNVVRRLVLWSILDRLSWPTAGARRGTTFKEVWRRRAEWLSPTGLMDVVE